MNKCGFSLRRLVGISAAKGHISRLIGIPLSRSGIYMKVGRMVTRGGCLVVLITPIILTVVAVKLLFVKDKFK